jgi:hypothetical protein
VNADLFPDELPSWDGDGPDPLERYWTPRHCVDALLRHAGHMIAGTVWEPCAGARHISSVLADVDGISRVYESDISPVGDAYPRLDFLLRDEHWRVIESPVDWVVTNPAFGIAADIVRVALDTAHEGVAMLLPANFWEGTVTDGRRDLLTSCPPTHCIHLGRFNFIMPGGGNGPSKEHMWLIWEHHCQWRGLTEHIYHDRKSA